MKMNKLLERILYGASKPVVKTYTNTMLNMDIRQKSPFPVGAKIIAPNHPSTTDPFFVAAMLGHQSFIMINNVLFQVPVLGEYLRRSGHIPVIKGRGQEAIDAALEHLRDGHTVIIFPEGLISPLSGGYNKPRTGVARLALASGAPVFPVGIHLHKDRILSKKSKVDGKDEMGYWYIRGPYNVTVGKPLRFIGDVNDHDLVREVSQKVMLKIMRLVYESEQRWIRTNRSLPDALETV